MKTLNCGDVMPGCNHRIQGDTDEEVMRQAARHAEQAHGMKNIPPDVLNKTRRAIKNA